jgi:hypothetical protein
VTHRKAEEYRHLAQECLALALTVSTLDARASLVAMAQVWQRLADEQEQGSEFGPMRRPRPQMRKPSLNSNSKFSPTTKSKD